MEVEGAMDGVLLDGLGRYEVHRLEYGMNYVQRGEMVGDNLSRCPIVLDRLEGVRLEVDMPRHRFVGLEGY